MGVYSTGRVSLQISNSQSRRKLFPLNKSDKGFIGLAWFPCPSLICLLCPGQPGLSHVANFGGDGSQPLELQGLGMGEGLFLQGRFGCTGSWGQVKAMDTHCKGKFGDYKLHQHEKKRVNSSSSGCKEKLGGKDIRK